jgi:hypothetical protein
VIIFKIVRNFFIALLILFIVLIPVVIYLIKFNNSSFLGEMLKKRVLRFPELVELLNLNNPGDAKYIYFEPKDRDLTIGIISVNSEEPNKNINEWMREIISESVKRGVILSDVMYLDFPKSQLLTKEDLNEIRSNAILTDKNDLNLIYTSSYFEKDNSVGIVLHRDTIFIFKDAIDMLSERGFVKDVLEKTTIMHEWGHLLGLDHIDDENCIMNEQVQVLDSNPLARNLPTKYCWKELQKIEELN